MISSQIESLLLLCWDVFLVFSLRKQKETCAYIQSSVQRAVLVVVDEADLDGFGVRDPVLLISSHGHLGQNIYLVFHSAYSIFRDFVDRRHLRIGVKSMRIFITVLFAASLVVFLGCATVPAGSAALSFYTFDDSRESVSFGPSRMKIPRCCSLQIWRVKPLSFSMAKGIN